MQRLECVELLLFVLLPKISVPDIKNLGLTVQLQLLDWCSNQLQFLGSIEFSDKYTWDCRVPNL